VSKGLVGEWFEGSLEAPFKKFYGGGEGLSGGFALGNTDTAEHWACYAGSEAVESPSDNGETTLAGAHLEPPSAFIPASIISRQLAPRAFLAVRRRIGISV
jgi:hypothetical protein